MDDDDVSELAEQRKHALRAERTYTAAADHYRHPALRFWDRWGAATIDRISLSPGDRVLDVCCGAGASALPAAQRVGITGQVLGLDLAEPLLDLARQRARDAGFRNVSFRRCDATASGLASESFDAVVCVFGVFFAADMPGFVREMWRLVRPKGTLAITTWGPQWCEPASGIFWSTLGQLQPALVRAFNPWDEITTEQALRDLLTRAGVGAATVEATSGEFHQLHTPRDFWDIVLGSGYRATVDALNESQHAALRRGVLHELSKQHIDRLHNDVVFARASKRPAS